MTEQTPDPLDDLRAILSAQRAYLEEHGFLYDSPSVELDDLAWAIRQIEMLRDQTAPPPGSHDLEDAFIRHRTASPGPWTRDRDVIVDAHGQPVALTGFSAFPARDPQAWHLTDAEFIAHAWEDIENLLAEVRRLAAALDSDHDVRATETDHGVNGGTLTAEDT